MRDQEREKAGSNRNQRRETPIEYGSMSVGNCHGFSISGRKRILIPMRNYGDGPVLLGDEYVKRANQRRTIFHLRLFGGRACNTLGLGTVTLGRAGNYIVLRSVSATSFWARPYHLIDPSFEV